ncbi:family 4 glycosyltransferase [Podospora didyma]|uniref:Family 4 glycosyltransferase n=1 Tax=Podospora didyma TaxID=330526 RepID=A0AAE0NYA7_9PEZI|nr:family 4 glycosyltransferase [Podospora didyma]
MVSYFEFQQPPAQFPDSLQDKRILLCTESYGPVNGVSRTTRMLVKHLRAHGAVVAVVAPRLGHQPAASKAVPTCTPSKIGRQYFTDLRIAGWRLPFSPDLSVVYPVLLSTLYAETFGGPPDLIYLASPASLGFQVLLQLRQQPAEKQIPVICNFQTDLAGYCAVLFPPPFNRLATATFNSVQSFLFNHHSVKTVFYPSRFSQKYLEKIGVDDRKLDLLQRGVDTELFNPAHRSDSLREKIAPNGEIILICVARLAGEKGFDFLAKVASSLDEYGLDFKLYIVGNNRNETVEAEIKHLFSDQVEKGNVIFTGLLTGDALATAYASADIFLHCSVSETFGLVVLESMASGMPVIARDEGGPSDIIQEGKTGYLLPPSDVEQFVVKVVRLSRDASLRAQLGKDARLQAEQATWARISNTVAVRMAEVIEDRQAELGSKHPRLPTFGQFLEALISSTWPTLGWLLFNEWNRAFIATARIAWGLIVIHAVWFVVGLYLIFAKVAMWQKTPVRG